MHLLYKLFFIAIISILHVEAKSLILYLMPVQNETKVLEDFLPLTTYIKDQLDISIELKVAKSNEEVIRAFENNEADIVYLGPLPLALLQQKVSALNPIVLFNESDGSTEYRCALVKFSKDALPLPNSKPIRVALTQPLSTCGFWQTNILLDKNLSSMHYRYTGNHDNVALSIIRGAYDMGGIKESIAKEYASLGLEVLDTSALLPSFMLLANAKTMTNEEIERIQNTLLAAPKSAYQSWGKPLSYGMQRPNLERFNAHHFLDTNVSIPSKGNF